MVSVYSLVCRDPKRPVRQMPNCDLSVNGRKGRVRATSGSEVGESRRLRQKQPQAKDCGCFIL